MPKQSLSIGVIGESDVVMAFRSLGMEAVSVHNAKEAGLAIHRLIEDGRKMIFITEPIAKMIPDLIDHYDRDPDVTLLPIPGGQESSGLGMERIHRNVEKAIGTNILLNNTKE